jgi:hypothetical protein
MKTQTLIAGLLIAIMAVSVFSAAAVVTTRTAAAAPRPKVIWENRFRIIGAAQVKQVCDRDKTGRVGRYVKIKGYFEQWGHYVGAKEGAWSLLAPPHSLYLMSMDEHGLTRREPNVKPITTRAQFKWDLFIKTHTLPTRYRFFVQLVYGRGRTWDGSLMYVTVPSCSEQQPPKTPTTKPPENTAVGTKGNIVFSRPQYLIHSADPHAPGVWFLWPSAPVNNKLAISDTNGGTYSVTTLSHSGPYKDANAVRANAPAEMKGKAMKELPWGDFFIV